MTIMPVWMQLLCLIAGGTVGTISRFFLGMWAVNTLGMTFPWGTLLVNVLGCFLIGALEGLPGGVLSMPPHVRLLLITGFLGAFTTFSAFAYESSMLVHMNGLASLEGWSKFGLNIAANVILGLLALNLGLFAVRVTLGGLRGV